MPNETANWFDEENDIQIEKPEEKETPEGSQPEETKVEAKVKPEESETPAVENKETEEEIPFHKHPRFRALIQDNNELKATVEKLNEALGQVQTKVATEEQDTIPEWFVNLYGDDHKVWSGYQQQRKVEVEQLQSQILSQLQPKLQEIEKETKQKQIESEIDNQLKQLEEEGNKFDKNALMKVVADNQLFDINGNFNFKAGLALLNANQPKVDTAKVEAKKAIAAKTNSVNAGGTIPEKDYVTPADIRNRDWRSFYNKQ